MGVQVEPEYAVTPTSLLINYLNKNVDSIGLENDHKFDIHKYTGDLRSNITPRYQTKFRILNEINNTKINPEDVQEIESIIDCAIFSSRIYQGLCRYFKKKEHAYMLIEYFRIV